MILCDSQPAHLPGHSHHKFSEALAEETKFIGQPYDPMHHTQLQLLSYDIPYHVQSWINSGSSVSATASVYIAK